jgi:hypothetical protein
MHQRTRIKAATDQLESVDPALLAVQSLEVSKGYLDSRLFMQGTLFIGYQLLQVTRADF